MPEIPAGWATRPSSRLADLHAACAAEGRDPATLEVTVGVLLAYPPDAARPEIVDHPGRFLTGSPAEVAAGLRGYAEQGVGHIIASLTPCTPQTIAELAEAVRLVRTV